jgi:O-antigen/teichoic acid export membrane protein
VSERKRVLFGTGYAFLSTLVALTTAILLRPILVRLLGLEEYGVLVLATSLLGIAALASDLGFGAALTKFVAEETDEAQRSSLITTALTASFLAALASTAILLVLASIGDSAFGLRGLSPLLSVLAWQVPFGFAVVTCLATLNGLRRMRAYGLGSIATSVLTFAIVAAFVGIGRTAVHAALGTVAAAAAGLLVLASTLRAHLSLPSLRFFRSSARRLVTFGIHLSATNAASVLLYQVDIVLLGWFTLDGVAIGYYSIAILLARALWILPASISLVGYPAISEYTKENRPARTRAFVDRAIRFSAGLVGLAVLGLLHFGPEVISGLFGDAALPAYAPLLVLLVGAGLLGVAKSVATGIASVGRPDLAFRIALVGLAASLGLNFVLIPAFGVSGAALATTTAYGLLAFLVVIYVRKLLVISIDRKWFAEAFAWVLGFALPLVAVRALGADIPIARWALGGVAVGGFGAVLYLRLWPREDTAYLVGAMRDSVRRPEPR